jgi:hypothetical protein
MELSTLITETLGFPGKMISGSKSGYFERHPTNLAIFNANVCTENRGKIWFGDLDITLEQEKLSALAVELNESVYVLREMDARFEHEDNPQLGQAIVIFNSNGTWEIGRNSVYSDIDPETLSQIK